MFEHDELGRLTRVLEDAGNAVVEGYSYDSYGNRRTRLPAGGSADHYLYDHAHQLTEIRSGSAEGAITASFVYDDNGNLVAQDIGGVTRNLDYDALERLQAVSGGDIGTETYAYDDQDRRIAKTVDGTTTQFLYSGASIWSEYGGDRNAALAHYSYTGLDEVIIRGTPAANDTRYYHHDGLGSVVATTKTAGALQASTRFDAWGNVISGGGIAQFGFTGREPDASGLIYYHARYYNPALGRFTQRDPSGFNGGLNPYTYVGNSPQNFTDPLGLSQQAVTAMSSQVSSFAGADTLWGGATDHVKDMSNTSWSSALSEQIECIGACHGISGLGDRIPLNDRQIGALIGGTLSGLGAAIAGFGCLTTLSSCVVAPMLSADTYRQFSIAKTQIDPLHSLAMELGASDERAARIALGTDYVTATFSVGSIYKGLLKNSMDGISSEVLGLTSLDIFSTTNSINQLNKDVEEYKIKKANEGY